MSKKEIDPFDFVSKETTGHDSMFAIVAQVSPQLLGDFSTANIVNKIRECSTDEKNKNHNDTVYKDTFSLLANMLKLASNRTISVPNRAQIIDRELTQQECNQLLQYLKGTIGKYAENNAQIKNSSGQPLSTIDDYIWYAQNNIDNPNTQKLREAIVTAGVEVGNKKEIQTLRHKIWYYVYYPKYQNLMKAKYPTLERTTGKYDEWNELEAILKTFGNTERFNEYDRFITEHDKKVDEYKKKQALCLSYKYKRARHFSEAFEKVATRQERLRADEQGISSVIFESPSARFKRGDVSWIAQIGYNPEVLCDLQANYSENGDETQRVIAISYGKFHYKYNNGLYDNSLIQPDIVGVTRIGKDGMQNYFVIIPIDTISFRDNVLLYDNESRFPVDVNGKETDVIDEKDKKRIYSIKSRKIPEDLAEFYATTFLSDEYLTAVEEQNYRYTGYITRTPFGPKINGFDIGKSELGALAYASAYPGAICTELFPRVPGEKTMTRDETAKTLDAFLNSKQFIASHLGLVREIAEGNYNYEKGGIVAKETPSELDKYDGEELI